MQWRFYRVVMNTQKASTTSSPVSRPAPRLLSDLHAGGALTAYQVERLLAKWPDLGEWHADPYFGTVREHSRAYIDQLARSEQDATFRKRAYQ